MPGISRPTISASMRSSRWNRPSVSSMPTASASARIWLTPRLTTRVSSASPACTVSPCDARFQNRHENSTMSLTRSSTESMNAPERFSSPRWRATDPSNTSSRLPTSSRKPATSQLPTTICQPASTMNTGESRVSCHGRTPVQIRNARIAR